MAELPYPINIGKKRFLTDIDGIKVEMVVEEEIVRPQRKAPHDKLICLQMLRFAKDKRLEYRFTYYMKGRKGKTAGRWVFGQYSLMIPKPDLAWLLKQAQKKNWPGF